MDAVRVDGQAGGDRLGAENVDQGEYWPNGNDTEWALYRTATAVTSSTASLPYFLDATPNDLYSSARNPSSSNLKRDASKKSLQSSVFHKLLQPEVKSVIKGRLLDPETGFPLHEPTPPPPKITITIQKPPPKLKLQAIPAKTIPPRPKTKDKALACSEDSLNRHFGPPYPKIRVLPPPGNQSEPQLPAPQRPTSLAPGAQQLFADSADSSMLNSIQEKLDLLTDDLALHISRKPQKLVAGSRK